MFYLPEHYHNLSLCLSEVLDDIGVNERMVKRQRRSTLLLETQFSLCFDKPCYIFGSRAEGTTTLGLKSDGDMLLSSPQFHVIQNYAEWKHGPNNLLMIQDEITSPGYCHLQLIGHDTPLPVTKVLDKHHVRDADGRILLKNTIFDDILLKGFKNGPAKTRKAPGECSVDIVYAVSCTSWPTEAKDWSQRSSGKWPTEYMKRYAENSGCFVVPVGSKISQMDNLEWRISTSTAERCLMFNLNITQIRCFVLLKMILKTYLQHPVSSYMCKTVLLRCKEKTQYNMWQENNLLTCLTVCLQALYTSILHKSCPHFFIPGNNLMAGQFSPKMKDKLLKSLSHILEGQGAALYGIQIDDLGERLAIKINPFYQSVQKAYLLSAYDHSQINSCVSVLNLALNICSPAACHSIAEHNFIGSPETVSERLLRVILNFSRLYKNGTDMERRALQLIVPLYCSSLGSVLASVSIKTNCSVLPEALNWLSAGLNSDVASGRLKLASVLFCAGDMLKVESVLREIERLYCLDAVLSVCNCYCHPNHQIKMDTCAVCYIQNEKAIKRVFARCVNFLPVELNCIPRELQYELFRSTKDTRLYRDRMLNVQMGIAGVDSLPFLYFLQYKTYSNLQSYNDQQRALQHLALTLDSQENFGHRETTLNLLGQCYEQENRLNDALVCYTRSLNVRGRNNVAGYHLCRLLADMQNNS